jgi:hypothetical protein
MQSLVKAPSQQSALPCKVDYFNDKLVTDGARLARSVRGQKRRPTSCRSAWELLHAGHGKGSVCRIPLPCGGVIYNIFDNNFSRFPAGI